MSNFLADCIGSGPKYALEENIAVAKLGESGLLKLDDPGGLRHICFRAFVSIAAQHISFTYNWNFF